jgi:hypothetical protein
MAAHSRGDKEVKRAATGASVVPQLAIDDIGMNATVGPRYRTKTPHLIQLRFSRAESDCDA